MLGWWEGGLCEVQVSEEDQFSNWGLLLKKIPGNVYRSDEGRATFNQQQQSLRKSRGFLSSPGTWLSEVQLPGLLGFPRGEEEAPGEQVELREEKGAKSESSPSTGLPYGRESQWDPSLINILLKPMNIYQVLSVYSAPSQHLHPLLHMFRPMI